MQADSPGQVMRTIGEIEDALATIESAYYQHVREEINLDEFLKTERAILSERAEGSAAEDRKQWVERQIRASDDHAKWVEARASRRAYEVKFDILSKRLSACQSVLKRHEQATRGPGLGAGQRNV